MRAGLATIEAGAGGRPLLLVHGFTGAKEDFVDHVRALADAGFHVVAPDLPGHGDSHPVGAAFGFDAYAADVLAVADDLGWGRFALLGHSMGGIVAQHVALGVPERLSALVLLDTSPDRFDVDAALVDLACEVVGGNGMPALLAALRELGSPLDTEANKRIRAERPDWDDFQDAKFLRCSGEMYTTMARLLTEAPDRSAHLAAVDVPTLVLVGEHDHLLRAPSERLAQAIPGARLVVLEGAGHAPQFESPAAFRQAVLEFLA